MKQQIYALPVNNDLKLFNADISEVFKENATSYIIENYVPVYIKNMYCVVLPDSYKTQNMYSTRYAAIDKKEVISFIKEVVLNKKERNHYIGKVYYGPAIVINKKEACESLALFN